MESGYIILNYKRLHNTVLEHLSTMLREGFFLICLFRISSESYPESMCVVGDVVRITLVVTSLGLLRKHQSESRCDVNLRLNYSKYKHKSKNNVGARKISTTIE